MRWSMFALTLNSGSSDRLQIIKLALKFADEVFNLTDDRTFFLSSSTSDAPCETKFPRWPWKRVPSLVSSIVGDGNYQFACKFTLVAWVVLQCLCRPWWPPLLSYGSFWRSSDSHAWPSELGVKLVTGPKWMVLAVSPCISAPSSTWHGVFVTHPVNDVNSGPLTLYSWTLRISLLCP